MDESWAQTAILTEPPSAQEDLHSRGYGCNPTRSSKVGDLLALQVNFHNVFKSQNLGNCPIMSGQWQLSKQLNPNCEESSCLESKLSLENAIRKAKMNVRVGSHKNIVQKTHAVVTAQLEFHRFLMNKRISEWYRINLSSVSHASPLTDSKWWQFWSGRSLDALSAALFFGHDIISPWFATRFHPNCHKGKKYWHADGLQTWQLQIHCCCSASAFRTMSAGSSYSAHAPSIAAIACLGVDMSWPVASGRWRFPETTTVKVAWISPANLVLCIIWVTLRFNSMVNRNKHQQPVVSEYGGDHLRSIFHTYPGTWFVSRPTNLNQSEQILVAFWSPAKFNRGLYGKAI